jgi:pimeloyl-ACP methyl ester carboxylesterase
MAMLGHSWGAGVMALYAAQYSRRVGRMVIVGGIPLTAKGLAAFFDGVEAGRDSASIQRMSQWEATLKANPEDQTACRELNALFFAPLLCGHRGRHAPAGRLLQRSAGVPSQRGGSRGPLHLGFPRRVRLAAGDAASDCADADHSRGPGSDPNGIRPGVGGHDA